MRVQRVVMPWDAVSWTVLEDDGSPVGLVDRFLGFLSSSEKSPNTVKSYAHDLKDWWCYLSGRGLAWDEVTLEDVASFVGWLRLPPPLSTGRVPRMVRGRPSGLKAAPHPLRGRPDGRP